MARRVFIRGSVGSSSIEWRCHCQGLAAKYEPAIFYAWSQSHQWHWLHRHRKVSEVTKRSDICRTCSDKQTIVKNKSEKGRRRWRSARDAQIISTRRVWPEQQRTSIRGLPRLPVSSLHHLQRKVERNLGCYIQNERIQFRCARDIMKTRICGYCEDKKFFRKGWAMIEPGRRRRLLRLSQ